jgi:hypothetical protein
MATSEYEMKFAATQVNKNSSGSNIQKYPKEKQMSLML